MVAPACVNSGPGPGGHGVEGGGGGRTGPTPPPGLVLNWHGQALNILGKHTGASTRGDKHFRSQAFMVLTPSLHGRDWSRNIIYMSEKIFVSYKFHINE